MLLGDAIVLEGKAPWSVRSEVLVDGDELFVFLCLNPDEIVSFAFIGGGDVCRHIKCIVWLLVSTLGPSS